jgi:glycosyltransferase involved in cell wall biosynthesis
MKRVKVLYLIDTLAIGGAEKSLVDIAIHNTKIESIFITIYNGDGLVSLLKQNSIEVHQLNNSFRYKFDTVVDQLLPLIGMINPDIIHSTLFRSDIIARKVKQYRNIPLISSFVNNTYLSERYRTLSLLGKVKLYGCQLMDKWSAKNVDLFISNSATIMETNSKALGIKKEKVKVIYRGRSSKKFDSISDQEAFALRLKLNINSDTKILLNVSRLLDRKGQLDLLKSYAEVVKKYPDTMLLFAGEGAFRATLEKTIDDLQLKEKVVLLGNVDYIPLLLKMADVFIFPSHYEGLPGALIEAMFIHKIIICSDIGENKECVSDTEAIFFKTHDIEDLTIKISMVLNNLKEYEPMAINAKKAAISKFELATIISQYNGAYQNLLGI